MKPSSSSYLDFWWIIDLLGCCLSTQASLCLTYSISCQSRCHIGENKLDFIWSVCKKKKIYKMARWTAFCFAVSAQLCICYEIERIENWKLQLSRFTNFRAWLGSILNSFIAEQILDDIIHFIIGIYISKMQTFHHKKK